MIKPTKKQKIEMLEIANAFLKAEIAELEIENKLLKQVEQIFNDSPDLEFSLFKQVFPDEYEAHNLEQQAKGLIDFSYNKMATNPGSLVSLLIYCANVLLDKAKALKEQVK